MVRHQLPLHGAGVHARGRRFTLSSRKPIEEYEEAKSARLSDAPGAGRAGHLPEARQEQGSDASIRCRCSTRCCRSISRFCASSPKRGAEWVQLDEPCLVLDLNDTARQALQRAYAAFAKAVPLLKIMLTTYFGGLGDNLRNRTGAACRRPPSRPRARAGPTRRRRHPCTEGSGLSRSASSTAATSGARISLRSLDRLEAGVARPGSRPRADRAVLLAAACSDRSRAGNRSRSRREKLACLLRAEDRGTGRARHRRSPATAATGR